MELNKYFEQELIKISKKYEVSFMNSYVIVAVSTGVDSSCLLDLLKNVREKYQLKIVIAHVNHGKRKQSEIEEEYIVSLAKKNNFNIELLHLGDDDFSGKNFQEEARIKRINFFKEVMDKYNTKYLFLAHQLNDEAETIIMHLMRNSSLNGLCGIKEVLINHGYYFIRPLIDIKKEELYAYAKEFDIKFFEDYTNQEDHYTRNQVRHHLIDETFKGELKNSIDKYKERMNEACELVNQNRDRLIEEAFIINQKEIKINLSKLNKASQQEKLDALFEVLKNKNFSISNIEEIIKIINQNGNVKNKYKNILILKEYDLATIVDYEEKKDSIDNCNVFDKEGVFQIDEKHFIEIKRLENSEALNKSYEFDVSNKDIIWYNDSMLPFVIRKKRDGDRIKIKDGTKKINELLVDLKVPLSQRERVMVLIDKNGDIISVLGIRKSYLLNEMENNNLNKNLIVKTNFFNNI